MEKTTQPGEARMPNVENSIPSPGECVRREMESRGWTQRDLAQILDRPLPTVNEIINGKRAIMPEMAVALAQAFGSTADLWMQREAAYRLSLVTDRDDAIRDRARLYEVAPIKEMMKRGWIKATDNTEILSDELKRFFATDSLDELPSLCANTKKTGRTDAMTAEQRAWCIRARNMSRILPAEQYSDERFDKGIAALKKIAAWPEEVKRVPKLLSGMGIRFVVLEPLMRTKIDGAAFWLDECSPVVALSARYDRIDSFWHSLCHELSHIRNRDGLSVDASIVGDDRVAPTDLDATERRADADAAAYLIDPDQLHDFITRVGPLYSTARINQFANKLCIHPGIIVGQLQYRAEVGYSAFRNMLVKVRDFVTAEAMTDGWGHTLNA